MIRRQTGHSGPDHMYVAFRRIWSWRRCTCFSESLVAHAVTKHPTIPLSMNPSHCCISVHPSERHIRCATDTGRASDRGADIQQTRLQLQLLSRASPDNLLILEATPFLSDLFGSQEREASLITAPKAHPPRPLKPIPSQAQHAASALHAKSQAQEQAGTTVASRAGI